MLSRERIKLALEHKESDRIPIQDSLWDSTIKRWKSEGVPEEVNIGDYFKYEMKYFYPDISMQFPQEILDENDEYIIERNNFGEVIKNHKNISTTPQVLDNTIKNKEDWENHKGRLVINNKRGISLKSNLDFSVVISIEEGLGEFKKYYEHGKYMIYGVLVGFDLVQRYVGTERLLISVATEPTWVKEMFLENAKFIIKVYEHMESKGYKFDGVFIYDDLGYRNASLISPKHYKNLVFDMDKLICDYFHGKGLKVLLHSDGNVNELIPFFIEAGIDCLQPLEVKANMDLVSLKRRFGEKMSFMGGIDTRLYSKKNIKLVEEEIKTKFKIAKRGGGYIYHCDHSIPHNVSLEQYKRVLDYVHKYGVY